MELTSLTLNQAAALLEHKEISPVELTKAHIERIELFNDKVNAFITVTPELALQQARLAEQEIINGIYKGPLHGIPLGLKDLFETEGIRTTAGSTFFSEYFPKADAAVVQKLKGAGCVLVGKLNMHEIALGVTNENPHYGDCCNPWDLKCISGGSSGGNAAALAAGLCMGAVGSDTGGSIRIPSACCGVVGLKPTYGRVSLRGVIPLSWNLDHAGPMARCVRDVAILLNAIAGYDPQDAWSVDQPVVDYLSIPDNGIQGWRIALANNDYFTDPEIIDPEVHEAIQQSVTIFENLGARVDEVALSEAREAAIANGLMTPADAAAFHYQRLVEQPQGFGSDVLKRLQTGASFRAIEYAEARRLQTVLRHQFDQFFNEFDLLLTPTVPITAPRRGSADALERARLLTRFTAPFNLTGLPALSLLCGWSKSGLPIGLQIVGKAWTEDKVILAGELFERCRDLPKQTSSLV
ncbi:MAG: Asp-tRNA(Asn)/Glu-tRNA(Gln) amidotransferase subunit GatA [Anaerolineales bacterium]|nr:MAG: Asp-tRNA(Asn)/Glu-tRNA(Gln) amidotransferase subunit GatA [Anaerolineales bacterium]